MKKYALLAASVMAVGLLAKSPSGEIPGTDLVYQGPGTVTSVTDPAQLQALLTNAPYGGMAVVPPGLVAVVISNASGGASKIKAKGKSSLDRIAVFFYGDTSMLQIDCGQSDCNGQLEYLYAKGDVGKVLLKGLGYAGKLVVDNVGSAKGVQIQNISKTKGHSKGDAGGNIHSVITSGKLDKLQSNHGYIGGPDQTDPGVLAVGTASPNGQVKPKAGIKCILICGTITSNQYNYAQAYAECIASNAILPYVTMTSLKQLNTKAIGPAVCAVTLEKKCSSKKTDVTEPVVGKENVLD